MDRYVVREPRVGAEYPQGNQPMAFRANAPRNNTAMIPENMYYGGYGMEPPPMYAEGYVSAQNRINAAAFTPMNRHPSQSQMMSGIDPRYLASYSDNSAPFIVSGQQMQEERPLFPVNFGNDYKNRSLVAPDRSKTNVFVPQVAMEIVKPTEMTPTNKGHSNVIINNSHNNQFKESFEQGFQEKHTNVPSTKIPTEITPKEDTLPHVMTRSEKVKANYRFSDEIKESIRYYVLKSIGWISGFPFAPLLIKIVQQIKVTQWLLSVKLFKFDIKKKGTKHCALQKSGPRVFSGPIEKVLKWHKSLQEIGVLIIYEIVAKCVSVRPGDSCAKNLVVRDDNGPAMQVVYYEIDFLLPELKPPCTVRVVGRMMAGTCRLQAFNVRVATGDDVATLPRRAAVAAHHVAKLCKEYGVN